MQLVVMAVDALRDIVRSRRVLLRAQRDRKQRGGRNQAAAPCEIGERSLQVLCAVGPARRVVLDAAELIAAEAAIAGFADRLRNGSNRVAV